MSQVLSQVSQTKRIPIALARKYGLYDDADVLAPHVGGGRRGGRHSLLAPRGHQFSASAAAAGLGDPGHAGLECDRHRARAHAQPAAQCARDPVHPGGRCRRDPNRHRRLAEPPGRRRACDQGGPARGLEQDRRTVGRAEKRGRDRGGDRAPGQDLGAAARRSRPPRSSPCPRRRRCWRRSTATTPCLRKSRLPQLEQALSQGADSGQARYRRHGDADRDPHPCRGRALDSRRAQRRDPGAARRTARPARQESGRRRAHDGPHQAGEGSVRARDAALHRAANGVHAADDRALRIDRTADAARDRRRHAPAHRGEPVHQGRARWQ